MAIDGLEEAPGTAVDLIVLQAPVAPDTLHDPILWSDAGATGRATLVVRQRDLGLLLTFADGLRVFVQAGSPHAITLDATDVAATCDVGHLLVDQVLPRCLGAWTDTLVLHAAAIGGVDGAWVLAGPSGRGKSTLAHAAQAHGRLLMADDAVALTRAEGACHARRLRGGVRLGTGGGPKTWQPAARHDAPRTLPVRGFVQLGATPTRRLAHRRLRGADAALAVLGAAFRLTVTDRATHQRELAILAGASAPFPVHEVDVPRVPGGTQAFFAWLAEQEARRDVVAGP
jgi:hypothetical protein